VFRRRGKDYSEAGKSFLDSLHRPLFTLQLSLLIHYTLLHLKLIKNNTIMSCMSAEIMLKDHCLSKTQSPVRVLKRLAAMCAVAT
jgi:hypothetical protein